jgi:hypothetical protein
VGKQLTLREIRGVDNVIQLVDKQNNMLELRMKADIDEILRHVNLKHIKKIINNKGNFSAN